MLTSGLPNRAATSAKRESGFSDLILEQEFSLDASVVVCEFYQKGDSWRFAAVARGFAGV